MSIKLPLEGRFAFHASERFLQPTQLNLKLQSTTEKMKLTLTVLTLLLSGLALCVYPPPTKDSEWLTGKDKEKEGIDVPEPGGNWRVIIYSLPPLLAPLNFFWGEGMARKVQSYINITIRVDHNA